MQRVGEQTLCTNNSNKGTPLIHCVDNADKDPFLLKQAGELK